MANWDKFVKLAMNDKSWTSDCIHAAQIIELLGQKETQESDLVRCNTLDRGVWGHQDEASRLEFRCDVGGRTTA